MLVIGYDNPVTALVEFEPNFYDLLLIDHNSAMMEAIKGALDAKSKASFMAMKDSLGWK